MRLRERGIGGRVEEERKKRVQDGGELEIYKDDERERERERVEYENLASEIMIPYSPEIQ